MRFPENRLAGAVAPARESPGPVARVKVARSVIHNYDDYPTPFSDSAGGQFGQWPAGAHVETVGRLAQTLGGQPRLHP